MKLSRQTGQKQGDISLRIACAIMYVCKTAWRTWEAVNCLEFFEYRFFEPWGSKS